MSVPAGQLEETEQASEVPDELVEFADHLADILASDYVSVVKEERHASSRVCEVLEREPTRAEH